ncbi:ACP S-malonyltransferase [Stomatobaculum sp. F0698]|uniref:ACP S-malonyltransferase n=1 Tax=Stomatobaculum sp. F0698 TaxID=3059030 RepID=UPI00272ABF32|nr:ACP S-malonyltransferase [Stomatobaculum sp. F0698]WLD86040.1 ACP S-malonyltransferase [Stomatobaculum sp. F0698]
MSKKAFLFPGQGAQKVGMGQSFYEADADARAVFDEASELLGYDMKALCFEENEKLNLTQYTQPAMVTTGIAIMKVVEKQGLLPDTAAGLSLGEYEALYAAGALSVTDAIRVVARRGELMEAAVPAGVGAMAAVLGAEASLIEETLSEIPEVWIANYNCPGQIVISGKKEAVEAAAEALKARGIKRVLMLNVSGPFHSGLLREAGEELGKVLAETEIHPLRIPYYANVTGDIVEDAAKVRGLLTEQVYSSVRFEQSIRNMLSAGVDTFYELGPGKTLAGFVKKIDREATVVNIETMEDLAKI